MALPDGVLSTRPVPARFFGARSGAVTKTIDYEDGGIAIQDPSRGLLYQRWRARLFNVNREDSYVVLDATYVPEFVLVEEPFLTEISFTFDQNMRPVLAYVAEDVAYLRWYNTASSTYVTDEIGAGIITPRVAMDDKRYVATNGYQTNDVILAYIKNGNLYYRQQRDRFEDEYLLETNVNPIRKIGFSRGLRFQWQCEL